MKPCASSHASTRGTFRPASAISPRDLHEGARSPPCAGGASMMMQLRAVAACRRAGSAGSWRRPRPAAGCAGSRRCAGAMPSSQRRRRLGACGIAPADDGGGGEGQGLQGSLMDNRFYKSTWRPPDASRRAVSPTVLMHDLTTQGVPRPLCPDPGGAGGCAAAAARRMRPSPVAEHAPACSSPAQCCARTFPGRRAAAAAHLLGATSISRPHRPGDRDRGRCPAAPRRHGDPRRPAGVLRSRTTWPRPAATCASTAPAIFSKAPCSS